MPHPTNKPIKWTVANVWRPLTWGSERFPNFTVVIYDFWDSECWADREYCALYGTKKEAEIIARAIIRSYPGEFASTVIVVPTARRYGTEKDIDRERARRRQRREREVEASRAFKESSQGVQERLAHEALRQKRKG